MKITVTKPDATLYEGEVKLAQLPGSGGLFEVLHNHAPIISSLTHGILRIIDTADQEHLFEIRGGIAKSQQNDLLILVQ